MVEIGEVPEQSKGKNLTYYDMLTPVVQTGAEAKEEDRDSKNLHRREEDDEGTVTAITNLQESNGVLRHLRPDL